MTVAISGSAFSTTTADGTYSLANVPYGTTGDLTATLAGYSFSPPSFHISNLDGNIPGEDFAATMVYTISGKITLNTPGGAGLANVVVSYGSYSDKTAADGSYTVQNLPAGASASLTPTLAGYTFNPVNISSTISRQTRGTKTLLPHSIRIPFPARSPWAVVNSSRCDGSHFWHVSTTTLANGAYKLVEYLPYGTTGDLTPDLTGYTFSPTSSHISNLTGESYTEKTSLLPKYLAFPVK